jgi:hypothetical protein
MDKIPAIRNNPVVLVGESYGGVRAGAMLDILTDVAPVVGGSSIYVDPVLEAELNAHFAAVFPGSPAARIDRFARAKQFGWQVLIQPLVAGRTQFEESAKIYEAETSRMAGDLGISVEQLLEERCHYDGSETREWCDDLAAAVERTVTTPETFELLFGVEPGLVPGMPASQRGNAFRFVDEQPPSQPALAAVLGVLPAWDAYFRKFTTNSAAGAFSNAVDEDLYGYFFARALRQTHTMITNARWDTVVLSESIVPALKSIYDGLSTALVTDSRFVPAPPGQRPTRFVVEFPDLDGFTGPRQREVFFPTYEHSGHFVTAKESAKLLSDIKTFLSESGLGTNVSHE